MSADVLMVVSSSVNTSRMDPVRSLRPSSRTHSAAHFLSCRVHCDCRSKGWQPECIALCYCVWLDTGAQQKLLQDETSQVRRRSMFF